MTTLPTVFVDNVDGDLVKGKWAKSGSEVGIDDADIIGGIFLKRASVGKPVIAQIAHVFWALSALRLFKFSYFNFALEFAESSQCFFIGCERKVLPSPSFIDGSYSPRTPMFFGSDLSWHFAIMGQKMFEMFTKIRLDFLVNFPHDHESFCWVLIVWSTVWSKLNFYLSWFLPTL
jgi:hypothetical protein